MSPNNACPSCGAALEENVGSACPFCGSALSAPTIISAPAIKKKAAQSSAESMDEVKNLLREGDTAGATLAASAAFDLNPEDAKTVVEQTATDMRFSGREPAPDARPAPASTPAKPVMTAGSIDEPKPSPNLRPWIIGCSIGAAVLLCICLCLPIALAVFGMNFFAQ